MGGTVNVKSVIEEGSTFSIVFRVMCKVPDTKILDPKSLVNLEKLNHQNLNQLQRPKISEISDPNTTLFKTLSLINQHKPALLLVNDDPFLLCGYQNQLEKFFVVTTAENGL